MGAGYQIYGVPEPMANEPFPMPPEGTIVESWWPAVQDWRVCTVIGMRKNLLHCVARDGQEFGSVPVRGNFRESIYGQQMDLFQPVLGRESLSGVRS